MTVQDSPIKAVPTNIITGFLGTGKTTAILHLLQHKPKNERWAVLVNEFGEIGVDGSIIEGKHRTEQGVYVREVPGGCMCCAAGLPMQIALNQLLQQARPDRLLIEPTGLGHPKEVMQVLSAGHYQDVLNIQQIVTLVDARQLREQRYTQHDTFNQQIAIADLLIGNKQDLYQSNEMDLLRQYARAHTPKKVNIEFTTQGTISPKWLAGDTNSKVNKSHHHHHGSDKPSPADIDIPVSGYVQANNRGEGFESIGWRFSPQKIFSRKKLQHFMSTLEVTRLKAVFITEQGIYGYNHTPGRLAEIELDDCLESRIEIIAPTLPDDIKEQLFSCLVD